MTTSYRRKLPPLNALKAFEAAARLGSFTLAAEELSVSASAISRHIANLENYLQVQLFWRRHNEVGLTTAGYGFAPRIGSAMGIIEDESRRISQTEGHARQLHVHAVPTFSMCWLLPRLKRFQDLDPKTDFLLTTMYEADADESNFGVTLQTGVSFITGGHSRILFESEVMPVCSPEYLEKAPPLRRPEDLIAHRFVHSVNRLTDWRQYLSSVGLSPHLGDVGPKFGNSALAYAAAASGLGVACAERRFVLDDIKRGRLVAPLEERFRTGSFFAMNVDPIKADLPAVKRFSDWLMDEVRAEDVELGVERPPEVVD
jgi:LysR family transcriptional regulator, glycine cleavage system transcriptional activator